MQNKKQRIDDEIMNILNELSDNKVIDIKTCKTQLDRQYAYKYNFKPNINICQDKRFNDYILVYGIIYSYKENKAKPIRYHKNVFKYIKEKKEDILKWLSNYKFYEIKEDLGSKISEFDIFELKVHNYNNKVLVININANNIKSFEHDEIKSNHIRYNNFKRFIENIDKIYNDIEKK